MLFLYLTKYTASLISNKDFILLRKYKGFILSATVDGPIIYYSTQLHDVLNGLIGI